MHPHYRSHHRTAPQALRAPPRPAQSRACLGKLPEVLPVQGFLDTRGVLLELSTADGFRPGTREAPFQRWELFLPLLLLPWLPLG